MSSKRRRTRTRHEGVKLIAKRRGDRTYHVARWLDPISGRPTEVSLSRLGLANRDARRSWAERKAASLAVERQKAELGVDQVEDADLGDLLRGQLDTLALELRPKTLKIYGAAIESLISWAENASLTRSRSLSRAALAKFRDYLTTHRTKQVPLSGGRPGDHIASGGRLSAGGVNVRLRAVRALLTRLARRGQIPLNRLDVADALPLLRHDLPEPRVLAKDEIAALLQAAMDDDDSDCADFVASLLLSGCRFSELADLTTKAVNLDTNAIRLAASGTKGRKPRVIDLIVSPSLKAILERRGPGALFPGFSRGSRAKKMLRRLKRRSGIERLNWQALRSTCGSYVANAPFGGAYVAAARLGHGVQVSEKHYLRAVRIPTEARSIEQAMQAEPLFAEIARKTTKAGGRVVPLDRQTG